MHFLYFLFASLFLCQVSSESIEKIILDYFQSESVRRIRKGWENYRTPMEHAISTALKETVSFNGTNVYVRNIKEKLAAGYFHNDNQVLLVLKDLDLKELPRCPSPEVQFFLASNVLKIQTTISKIIIHAEYALVRNKTDILYEPKDQDPYKSSPFLFGQAQDIGKVAISIDGCILSGFIITTLYGESVNLGYNQLRFSNCLYTVEIYRPGEDSPPVIAKYNPYTEDEDGLGITHLLMKPLSAELVPKIQGAILSFVNTSAIFGKALRKFRVKQKLVFQATSQFLTEIIRNLNRITVEKNHGALVMDDYHIYWDDGRIKPNIKNSQTRVGESMRLMDLVLTGLDTMYSAHSGGPYKMDTILIAEEIRFSSLQVRGSLEIQTTWTAKFEFAVEIQDMVVDLQLDVNKGKPQGGRDSKNPKKNKHAFKLEVTGLKRMTFMVPTLMFESAESMISGYLLNELPKLIKSHLKAIFPEALKLSKTKLYIFESGQQDYAYTDNAASYAYREVEFFKESEVDDSSTEKLERERNVFRKYKKRFKSANRPFRRHFNGRAKHEVDKQIIKK